MPRIFKFSHASRVLNLGGVALEIAGHALTIVDPYLGAARLCGCENKEARLPVDM